MQNEPQQTSMSNVEYNLVSTVYHSLKAAQTYAAFARDAQAAGDQELTNFFLQMQRQCDQGAQMARQWLARSVNTPAAR